MVVMDIRLGNKKIFFLTLDHSPSQGSEKFALFIDKLHSVVEQIKSEKPHAMILTGDYNRSSSQWWPGDTEQPEGNHLDEFIETNNLHQVISEATNIRGDSMLCIDRIMTDQPAYVVETGVGPS